MTQYTRRQSRFAKAFSHSSTLCVTNCQCGRVHFTSAPGHGDYNEGELQRLQACAAKDPGQKHYVEDAYYDTIDTAIVFGHELVPDCPCGKADQIAKALELEHEDVAAYLRLFIEDREAARAREGRTGGFAGECVRRS